jgi:DNA-binding transcriptional regulator YiaG
MHRSGMRCNRTGRRRSTRLDVACRNQLGLLQPEMIRAQRETLGLSQAEMAAALHMPDSILANLEEGQIAPRDTDTLLRLFFKLPEVRRDLGVVDGARAVGTPAAATGEVENLRWLDV